MADNDIFRPNASIRPTVDRGFQRAKPDLKTSGRRVQQGSVLLLMAIGISLVIVFLPPDIFEQRAEMAFWVVAGLLTVFGVLWISAIGVLGAAVAGSVLEESEGTEEIDSTPKCPACSAPIQGAEAACPGCGIALV